MSSGAAAVEHGAAIRLKALREELRSTGLDGLLVSHLANIRYLTGFSGSSGLLLVLPDESLLFTDFRYEEQANTEVVGEVRPCVARDGLLRELADQLNGLVHPRRLGFEAEHTSVRDRHEMGELCGRVVWEPAPRWVEQMRSRKDEREIEAIGRAASIAAAALAATLDHVDEGRSELEVVAELEFRLRQEGSEAPPFESIVASGDRSALPHARPSKRRLREGDLLLVDFGARVDGYCSDLTRTVVLGRAAPWQQEAHQAVCRAQERAMAALGARVAAREVDTAARAWLERVGFGPHFGHGTGHGLGLEVHEAPRIYRRSEDVLESGNVVTVEPGVYLRGKGGVRIEDDVLVEAAGSRALTRFPRTLREL